MLGSFGSVSTRWQENDFLITPEDVSKWDLDLEDIVQVRNGKREAGKKRQRCHVTFTRRYMKNIRK